MGRSAKTVVLVIAGVFIAAALFVLGVSVGATPSVYSALHGSTSSASSGSTDTYKLQQEILSRLDAGYYKKIDNTKLQRDAIDGMLAALNDPYTYYMDPTEYADFKEQTSGVYSGVGMSVAMKNRLVTVVAAFEGGPAASAGIKSNDIIVGVNGVSTEGKTLDAVVASIKGTEGSEVTLKIYRPRAATSSSTTTATTSAQGNGSTPTTSTTATSTTTTTGTAELTVKLAGLPAGGQNTEYNLVRKTIDVPVTKTTIMSAGSKKVAVIEFSTFSQNSAAALRAEVQKAIDTNKVDAIVLDLRGNLGGLLDEAVQVASIFIPKGQVVVSESGLHVSKEVLKAEGGAYSSIPLYVLTDGYSASASEVVSGALQDDKRATLVGERTYGKGLVQTVETLSNGGAVKLTVAVYLTPKGRDINKTGLTPDVKAADNPATPNVDECLQAALKLIAGSTAK